MRDTSLTFRQAIAAQETNEVFLVLLHIHSDEDNSNIYVVNDTKQITSNEQIYYPYPFEITLPDDNDENLPQAKITICNIDRALVYAIRYYTKPLNVTFSVIMASSPNIIEASFENFKLFDVEYDADTITGTLSIKSFLNEPFPGGKFTVNKFPYIV